MMGLSARLSAFALVVVAAQSCVVPDVDLSDTTCPCAAGWRCVDDSRCVRFSPGQPECDALITVEGFGGSWSTANTIWWGFDPAGELEDFLRYTLILAPTVEDLSTDRARAYTAETYPELGHFNIPRSGQETDRLRGAYARGLEPSSHYAAQLIATDVALCDFYSGPATFVTTAEPSREIVLFRDEMSQGHATDPEELEHRADQQGAGYHLEYDTSSRACTVEGQQPPEENGTCHMNLRYTSLRYDLSAITQGDFESTALFQFSVAYDASRASYWSLAWLAFEVAGENAFYRIEPITYPPSKDGAYVTFQIPLRVLNIEHGHPATGAPLSFDTIQSALATEFNVGGSWERDARVRIDDVLVRY